jgi:L-rhamnose mutarotase
MKFGLNWWICFTNMEYLITPYLVDETRMDELPKTEIMKKWWAYMADIMETNPDHSPVSVSLKDVFYMS